MGYNLAIGEAYMDYDKADAYLRIRAKSQHDENSPAFGEPTDHTNQRWPSYCSWSDFCEAVDIYDIMMSKDFYTDDIHECMIPDHPGYSVITQKHIDYIESRVDLYKKSNPTHIAKFRPLKPEFKDDDSIFHPPEHYIDDEKYDGNLCRAEWLLYWMKWAVENCEIPIFYNS